MKDALKFNLLRLFETKWFIPIIICFAIVGTVFLIMGNMLYLFVIPIIAGGMGTNSLILDERYHMNYYIDAMPFSYRNMVNATYITVITTTVLSVAFILILTLCMTTCFGWKVDPDNVYGALNSTSGLIYMVTFYVSGLSLFLNSIALSGFYYGLSKTLIYVLAFLAMIIIIILSEDSLMSDLAMFAVGVAAFALSWYTSVWQKEKRDI